MKLLGLPASNSSQSINAKLVGLALDWTVGMLPSPPETEVLDLKAYEMPLYSSDREAAGGVPAEAQAFFDTIGAADALIMSFAEHNGSYTAAFKNTYDWASRINAEVYQNKPVVMMATSPGQRGGAGVLETASSAAPFFGAELIGTFSLPSFYETFSAEDRTIADDQKAEELRALLQRLVDRLA